MNTGKIIKTLVKKSFFSNSFLAKQLGVSRRHLYFIYTQESVKTDYIDRISVIIGTNIYSVLAIELDRDIQGKDYKDSDELFEKLKKLNQEVIRIQEFINNYKQKSNEQSEQK